MNKIDVLVDNQKSGELFFEKEKNSYGFNYTDDKKQISLIMPYKISTYTWKNKLHPIFDMNMPEGYLFEILKQYISKEYGYIDDFLIFSLLCSNIQSRLTYKDWHKKGEFISYDLNEILQNDTNDTFNRLVSTYMTKNAISGIQPKSLAILSDKENLTTKEYIIKTWGDEYPNLAFNEYFCLKALQNANVPIPSVKLSKNGKFLVVEKFTYDKDTDTFFGFEEVASLLGKNKEEKYSGSYEMIANVIYSVTTDKLESIKIFYKVIVMNYLLKNGDAHLKNFGVIYDSNLSRIWFAPAYDVVNTVVYFHKDRPALTMFGKKVWFGKKELLKFGVQHCYLSQRDAINLYDECRQSLKKTIEELKEYTKHNEEMIEIGVKMMDCWKLSLDDNSYKEVPIEITRNWSKN